MPAHVLAASRPAGNEKLYRLDSTREGVAAARPQRIATFTKLRLEIMRALMLLLWCGGIARIFTESQILSLAVLAGLALFVLLGLPESGRLNRIFATTAGVLVLAISGLSGRWQPVLDGLIFSLVFIGFLPTLQLIRRTLEASPETSRSQEVFAAMPPRERGTGVMAGAHVLGSVLTLGVFAIIAPLVPAGSDDAARRDLARATLRGMGLALHWSPFTIGMGFALALRPEVPLWQAIAAGLVLSSAGIALGVLMFDRGGGFGGVWRALAGFRPLIVPLLGAMAIMVVAASALPVSTIEAVVLIMPVLCLLWLLAKRAWLVPTVAVTTYQGLNRLADDFLLFVSAVTLGRVLSSSPQVAAVLTAPEFMALPTPLILAAFMLLALVFPFLGIPALVSASLLLPILTALSGRLADIVAVQALLFAWGCGTMLSLASMGIVVATSLFRVPLVHLLFRHNALFMACYGIVAFALLAGANALLPH